MKKCRLAKVLPFLSVLVFLHTEEASAACYVTTQTVLPPPGSQVFMNHESSGSCTFLDVSIGMESVSNTPPPTIQRNAADFKVPFYIEDMSATLYYYPGPDRTITHCVDTTFFFMYWAGGTLFETVEFPEPELCYIPGGGGGPIRVF